MPRSPTIFNVSRRARFPNELSKAERALWQRIRREQAERTEAKRRRFGLSSNSLLLASITNKIVHWGLTSPPMPITRRKRIALSSPAAASTALPNLILSPRHRQTSPSSHSTESPRAARAGLLWSLCVSFGRIPMRRAKRVLPREYHSARLLPRRYRCASHRSLTVQTGRIELPEEAMVNPEQPSSACGRGRGVLAETLVCSTTGV